MTLPQVRDALGNLGPWTMNVLGGASCRQHAGAPDPFTSHPNVCLASTAVYVDHRPSLKNLPGTELRLIFSLTTLSVRMFVVCALESCGYTCYRPLLFGCFLL